MSAPRELPVGGPHTDAERNAAIWRAFWPAQLVLWCTMVLLAKVRLFTGTDPATWMRFVGPLAVALAVGAWIYQLRKQRGRLPSMLRTAGQDRTLLIGLLTHVLCLVALLCSLSGGPFGQGALIAGIVLLLVSSGTVWLRSRQESRRG